MKHPLLALSLAFILSGMGLTSTRAQGLVGYGPLLRQAPAVGQLGSSEADEGRATAVDAAGNSYFAGAFRSRAQVAGVGSNTLTSRGGADGYIACYSPAGRLRYLVQIGGAGEDEVLELAATTDGRLGLVGNFTGTLIAGRDTLRASGSADAFAAMLDTAGRVVWARRMGSPDASATVSDNGFCIAAAPDGGLAIGGAFGTSFTYGRDTARLRGNASQASGFVVRVGADGAKIWQTSVRGRSGNGRSVRGLAVSSAGLVYLAGTYRDTTFIGSGAAAPRLLNTRGTSVIYVATLAADGRGLKAIGIEGSSANITRGLALSGTVGAGVGPGLRQDRLLLAARYRDTAYIPRPAGGEDVVARKGLVEGLFVCLDTALAVQWHRSISSTGNDLAISACALPDGGWLGTGYFQFECRFDSASATADTTMRISNGASDVFLVRYTAAGLLTELAGYGSPGEDLGYGVRAHVSDATARLYVAATGYFTGRAVFPPSTQAITPSPAAIRDAFLVMQQTSPLLATRSRTQPNWQWWPNPAGTAASVRLKGLAVPSLAQLTTLTGQTVWQGQLTNGALPSYMAQIWDKASPGVYLLQIGQGYQRVVRE